MGRDNKDRYGYRHRDDSAYGMGESKPGDVGDSNGTFHDRAGTDDNVIVDGTAQSYETHKRNQQTAQSESSQSTNQGHSNQEHSTSSGQYAELDGEVVEVEVERISGSGNPIGTYRGSHVHIPNGDPGETYEVQLNAKSGYFVGRTQLDE